ncbi:helix-turn-helix transcriptional regulator [Actinoplanes subtropicus]|uniref:helix-turn-helix transcriptional regulator n=1 Tax=Actinoplanes subtropicus TaxID=543632 RepID=UPI0004C3EC8F|nr:hypothetical protein [Actinoplanes subtropicus]
MSAPDVLGCHEIAVRLGVSRSWANQLVRLKTFPDPVAHLAIGRIWDAEDVEAWIREHRPKGARD